MKFDDVIINEWGFGSDQPKMSGSAGGTRRDKKAKKIFLDNFMSEILLSLESAISAGLIRAPMAADSNQPNNMAPQTPSPMSETYLKLDSLIESIIGKDLQEGEEARDLKTFLRDWYGQWMTGVPLRKTKDTSDQIIEEIFKVYNASKNPNRPVIDRKLLTKLANASYAASTSHGQRPNTGTDRTSVDRTQYMPSYSSSQQAPTNDNSEKQASGTGSLPLPGDATPTTGTADDNEKQSLPQKGIDYDIKNGAILEVGKNRYVYDQTSDTWSGQDGEPADPEVQTALNNWVATSDRYQVPLEPLAVQDEFDLKVEPVGEPANDEFADKDRRAKHRDDKKNTVAESKTKSALRAEKIAQLTTR